MSGSLRLALYLFATVLGIFIVVKAAFFVFGLLSWIMPILAVVGIASILYMTLGRKALGPGGRRILP